MTREAVSEYLKSLPSKERRELAFNLKLKKEHIWCAKGMYRRTRRNQWLCPNYAIERIAKHMEAA